MKTGARIMIFVIMIVAILLSYPGGSLRAGGYLERVSYDPQKAEYFDLVDRVAQLRPIEKERLWKNGFVVTERLSYQDFLQAYAWIYNKDLPVMITTDAILEAIHQTQSDLLMRTETIILLPMVKDLLTRTLNTLRLAPNSPNPAVYHDVETYLKVATFLLAGQKTGSTPDETGYLTLAIEAKVVAEVKLFGGQPRKIDFTAFEPNGHYLKTEALQQYYRAMKWLGLIDFRLLDYNENGQPIPNAEPIAAAALLRDAMDKAQTRTTWTQIETMLAAMFGHSDNVTLITLDRFLADAGIKTSADALNASPEKLMRLLTNNDYGKQQIDGQIILTAQDNPTTQPYPVSFMLFGPRYTLDSYVLSQLVFDRLMVDGKKVRRAFPSPLDVMAAFGNDRAVTRLEDEFRQYGYQKNLNELRATVAQVGADVWSGTGYNLWLSALRSLNLPTTASNYPQAMQTAAWADKTLETQLASWAQLRHDTALYVKQTYTASIMCQYPAGYVEPAPDFYQAAYNYGKAGYLLYDSLPAAASDEAALSLKSTAQTYFWNLMQASLQLKTMAEKELRNEPFAADEVQFLKSIVVFQDKEALCGLRMEKWNGWYAQLYPFYASHNLADLNDYNPLVITGVHTNTETVLRPVGVLHVGTGPVATQLFIQDSAGSLAIYVSPVFTYYEFVEEGYPPSRLSDIDWYNRLKSPKRPYPPSWTGSFRITSETFPEYQVPQMDK